MIMKINEKKLQSVVNACDSIINLCEQNVVDITDIYFKNAILRTIKQRASATKKRIEKELMVAKKGEAK